MIKDYRIKQQKKNFLELISNRSIQQQQKRIEFSSNIQICLPISFQISSVHFYLFIPYLSLCCIYHLFLFYIIRLYQFCFHEIDKKKHFLTYPFLNFILKKYIQFQFQQQGKTLLNLDFSSNSYAVYILAFIYLFTYLISHM